MLSSENKLYIFSETLSLQGICGFIPANILLEYLVIVQGGQRMSKALRRLKTRGFPDLFWEPTPSLAVLSQEVWLRYELRLKLYLWKSLYFWGLRSFVLFNTFQTISEWKSWFFCSHRLHSARTMRHLFYRLMIKQTMIFCRNQFDSRDSTSSCWSVRSKQSGFPA